MTDLADEPSSLLEWATRLAVDPQLRARLAADPRGLLGEQGFAHVLPADLHHALPLVTDGVATLLGHDVDPALAGVVEAQRAGEHPLDALARQFAHVSEVVLAAPPSEDPEHDLDDHVLAGPHDPTAVLDDLVGPHDPGPDGGGPPDPAHHDDLHVVGAAVTLVGPHVAGTDPAEAGPVVGNEGGPDPLGDAPEHPFPDHPEHLVADHPVLEHADAYADVHHDAAADAHLAHDVLDL